MAKSLKNRGMVVGNFESMESRRLFAADLMGAVDLVDPGVAEVAQSEAGNQLSDLFSQAKPNPEDDNPLGPLGPVAKEVLKINVAEQMNAEQQAMSHDVEPDCDGNPLTATCDLTAEVPFDHAKPVDPEPDCDGNPLTATCDLTAEVVDDLFDTENPNGLIERLPGPPLPGDVDGDGDIDFADFLSVSGNWGMEEATRADGDLDGDGTVGFGDFLMVSMNYGKDVNATDDAPRELL